MGGTAGIYQGHGTAPIGNNTPPPAPTQPTPVNGQPVGGRTPKFFAQISKGLTSAFKSIGKSLAKLAPRQNPVNNNGFSKAANKAMDKFIAAKANNATQQTTASKTAMSQAKTEMINVLKAELKASPLMQSALNEPNQTVLHSKDTGYAIDVQDALGNALSNLIMRQPGAIIEARDRGMSVPEIVGLHLYTMQAYAGINAELRSDNPNGFVSELTTTICGAWDKLDRPPYVTNRLANLPPSVDSKYQEKQVVTDRGIGSAAHNVGNAFGSDTQSHVITIIPHENTLGRNVTWLSDTKGEDETLFPPGSQFEIVMRDNPKCPTVVGGSGNDLVFDFRVNLLIKEVNTDQNPWVH